MRLALTREISPAIVRCELTHLERTPIDVDVALHQHEQYEQALRELGCKVQRLSSGDDQPDSVFIEDTAVVLDEVAIIAQPGALSRRSELKDVENELQRHKMIQWIELPGTLDGGDVLRVGRRLFVGTGGRTNADGIAQLRAIVAPFGYTVHPVAITGCLHLKSAATLVRGDLLLVNPTWFDLAPFGELRTLAIDPAEPFAANALRVGERVIHADEFPRTRERLEHEGIAVRAVPASELAKAEGGVTCCSLVFDV
jgi:dimethylargininase